MYFRFLLRTSVLLVQQKSLDYRFAGLNPTGVRRRTETMVTSFGLLADEVSPDVIMDPQYGWDKEIYGDTTREGTLTTSVLPLGDWKFQ